MSKKELCGFDATKIEPRSHTLLIQKLGVLNIGAIIIVLSLLALLCIDSLHYFLFSSFLPASGVKK